MIQQDQRREFLDNAKKESATCIDEAQAPFRDSVESGQSIGEATTELQFGVNDGKSAEEAIENASHELFRQSTINAGRSDIYVLSLGLDFHSFPRHYIIQFAMCR